MRNSFFGLEVARLALWAQQRALDVTGHNVSNANTEGYSRQVAHLQTTDPYTVTAAGHTRAGQVGTGVMVADISRIRDAFLDRQARHVATDLQYWDHHYKILTEVESIFQEPAGEGLRAAFDEWWDGLLQLANHPESHGVRQAVVQRGLSLVAVFQNIDTNLVAIQENLAFTLRESINRANVLAEQVATLNETIIKMEGSGQRANDLQDKRDLLLAELAEIIPISVTPARDGSVNVHVGGRLLVAGDRANVIHVADAGGAGAPPVLAWGPEGSDGPVDLADLAGGRVGSILELMNADDGIIAGYRQTLLDMAVAFTEAINDIHQAVDPGDPLPEPLFSFLDPGSPSLATWFFNPDLVDDPAGILAGYSDAPGDGSRAAAMAALRHEPLIGDATLADTYNGIIGDVGVRTQVAERQGHNAQLLLIQVRDQQAAVAGVSLDEEMTNMLRFEHAYAAASRLVTALDEMLDLLINRTGLVGR